MEQAQNSDNFIIGGILDHFGSKLQQRDVDYFDEDSMIHYEFSDIDVGDKDASMLASLQYYFDYSLFYAYNILAGPVNIILDHAFLIWIALMARFIHLVIDLSPFPKRALLKDIVTCLLGFILLEQYLRRVSMESIVSCRTLIYPTLITFAMLANLHQAKRVTNSSSETGEDSAKIPNSSIIGNGSIVFAPIIINEYYIHVGGNHQHSYLRGILMTLAMKVVSQVYSNERTKSGGFVSQLTYLLHPASSISGLWHAKLDVANEVASVSSELFKFLHQIYRFSVTFMRTFFVLIISTNISELIYMVDGALNSSKLKLLSEVYLIAQEFRFSHYFSCLLFKSLFNIWEDPKLKESSKMKACKITDVEWPRSLLQVVTSWNIPMHVWLKDYVFKPTRQRTNTAAAIFFTYLISSILHGFKFHIWVVLLTLGFLTWVEYNLRTRLAKRYSACILAQPCRYTLDWKCTRGHRNTIHNSSLVKCANAGFRALAMAHLAYLGYIFMGNTDEANYRDVIRLWSELSFFGHFLAFGSYITSLFIR